MERRFDEFKGQQLIDVLETTFNKRVPEQQQKDLVAGAREVDLVRSGLDETMRTAYQEIREVLHSRKDIPDFRTAAYTVAIEKIARSYIEMGI